MHQDVDKEFFLHLSRSLKGLIGDKLNISALAYTPDEVYGCLDRKGLGEEGARGVKNFLEELEFRQYAAEKSAPQEGEALVNKVEKLLAQLDKAL